MNEDDKKIFEGIAVESGLVKDTYYFELNEDLIYKNASINAMWIWFNMGKLAAQYD